MFTIVRKLKSKLVWKMLVIYIGVIFIPSIFIGLDYYIEIESYILDEERDLIQASLVKLCNDIDRNLETAENVYSQLQRNTNFNRFLLGEYPSKSAQVSMYMSEFKNMFSYCFFSSHFIEDITVYMTNDSLLEMGEYLRKLNMNDFQFDEETDLSSGYWYYDIDNKQVIYRRLFKSLNAKNDLGILEIKCNDNIIQESLNQLLGEYRTITLVYADNSYDLGETGSESFETAIKVYGKTTRIPIEIIINADATRVNNSMINSLLRTIFCFILLSLILFFVLYQLSRRITKFSQSLESNLNDYPEMYTDKKNDELSMLIQNYNNMVTNNDYLLNQVKIEKLHQQEIEYRALQSQINPHFIYNTLEGIRMMAELQDEDDISDAVFSLSQLMKYAFNISEKEVSIKQELEYIRRYINLQKIRLGNRIDLKIFCDNTEKVKCPQFTLQPMVENSVKYGFGKDIHNITIRIDIKLFNNCVYVEIANSGKEIPEDKLNEMNRLLSIGGSLKEYSSGNGISLENVNNRMRYLHPHTFTMKLSNTGHGVTVSLYWELDE